jgi:hypothetical protein
MGSVAASFDIACSRCSLKPIQFFAVPQVKYARRVERVGTPMAMVQITMLG